MQTITLVTGNKGKLAEWRRLFPAGITLEAADIDLDEIQSLDLEKIVADKARRAYERIGKPVLVEDVAAGLAKLGGLPGPFIKYFELALGMDALFRLAEKAGDAATASCTIGYYDGTRSIVARGDVAGTVVPARGEHGFGFDKVFLPDGQAKTFGQMAPAEKDRLSHRGRAIKALLAQLS